MENRKRKRVTKLKNLEVTKVDFVTEGANPDAAITIFKAADPPEDNGGTSMEVKDPTLVERLLMRIAKKLKIDSDEEDDAQQDAELDDEGTEEEDDNLNPAIGDDEEEEEDDDRDEETIEKAVKRFSQYAKEAELNEVLDAIRMHGYGMSESMISIISDVDVGDKKALLEQNLDEYYEITKAAIAQWVEGKTSTHLAKSVREINPELAGAFEETRDWFQRQIQVAKAIQEDEFMAINKGKMSSEDLEVYEGLLAKYADEEAEGEVEKSATDTQSTIAKMATLEAEVEKLAAYKQSKEDEELMNVAKGYEVIGKSADEIFTVLKSLQGNQAAYDSAIAAYEAGKAAFEKSGIFTEIGKAGRATGNARQAIEKKAQEIMKSANAPQTFEEAIVQAMDENPELERQL